MQTTLRINDKVYREAKAQAARRGITLTKFIEGALLAFITRDADVDPALRDEIDERDRLMEGLLQATAHFRMGPKPDRREMNDR